jgi:hypothetical protein
MARSECKGAVKAGVLALVALQLIGGSAAAQLDAGARAKALKDLGARAFSRGDAQRALDSFQEAYRIYPSPRLLYDMGLAEEAMGRWADAIESFRSFLTQAPEAPERARQHATASLQALEPRVGRLVLVVDPPDAELTLDGEAVQLRSAIVRVMPGRHTLTARTPRHEPRSESVELLAGQSRTVELRLLEAGAPSPPPIVRAEPRPAPALARAEPSPAPALVRQEPAPAPAPRPNRRRATVAVTVALSAAALVGVALGLGFGLAPRGPVPDTSSFGVVKGTP